MVNVNVPDQHASMLATYWLQNLEGTSAVDRRLKLIRDITYLSDQIQNSPPTEKMETHLKFKNSAETSYEDPEKVYQGRSNLEAAIDAKNSGLEKLRTMQSKSFLRRLFWFIR